MSPDPSIPKRWTARRKAEFLAAIKVGKIGPEEINGLGISLEELQGWRHDFAAYGINGLRTTYRLRRRQNRRVMK